DQVAGAELTAVHVPDRAALRGGVVRQADPRLGPRGLHQPGAVVRVRTGRPPPVRLTDLGAGEADRLPRRPAGVGGRTGCRREVTGAAAGGAVRSDPQLLQPVDLGVDLPGPLGQLALHL